MKVSSVTSTTCAVPLERPVVLGDITYDFREYAVVKVETDAGLVGFGYGMTRNGPVSELINNLLAQQVVGSEALLTERIWNTLYYGNLPLGPRGLLIRAISLIDIALWDIKGKAAGMPVWKMVGGSHTTVEAQIAGGYARKGDRLDDLIAEMRGYVDGGVRKIKVASDSPDTDTDRLEACRDAVGDTWLAMDVHWAWRDFETSYSQLRKWEDINLAWVEDPLPSEYRSLLSRLREVSRIPFALGEDAGGRWQYRDIVRDFRPEYLRVDATNMGGLTEALKVCSLAQAESITVSPHIFPEIHVHLAAAFDNVLAVEYTDPDQEIDVVDRLLGRQFVVEDGVVIAPQSPGVGAAPDLDAVTEYAIR